MTPPPPWFWPIMFIATTSFAAAARNQTDNHHQQHNNSQQSRNAPEQVLHDRTVVTLLLNQQDEDPVDGVAETAELPGAEPLGGRPDELIPADYCEAAHPSEPCARVNSFVHQPGVRQHGERRRPKRSSEHADDRDTTDCQMSLPLDAFGRRFELCLETRPFAEEDTFREFYEDMNITLYGKGGEKSSVSLASLDLNFVVGFVRGERFSGVDGFLMDGMFFGSVYVGDGIFFVDPIRAENQTFSMFNDPAEAGNGGGQAGGGRGEGHGHAGGAGGAAFGGLGEEEYKRIQREMQTILRPALNAFMTKYQQSFNLADPIRQDSHKEQQHAKRARRAAAANPNEGLPRGQQQQQRRVCDVAVVVDHLFFREVGRSDVARTILQIFWIMKEANAVFQAKDFDDDGRSEMLGVNVAAITILTDKESDINILDGSYSTPEDFLKEFSRYNFSSYCLGVLFTNRIFDDLVLGLSWRGNPIPGGVGGICQSLARYKADGKTYSFNALFVSLRSQQQQRIPLRMAILNLVHELMHSFGAKHDPDAAANPACTPADADANGRFLMSRFSNNGRRLNHQRLSVCTKEAVVEVLRARHRTVCLRSANDSYCGDGTAQPGEACDCGTTYDCLKERSTCVPSPGGSHGQRGCQVRADPTSSASPPAAAAASASTSPKGKTGKDDARVKSLMEKFDQIVEKKYGKGRKA